MLSQLSFYSSLALGLCWGPTRKNKHTLVFRFVKLWWRIDGFLKMISLFKVYSSRENMHLWKPFVWQCWLPQRGEVMFSYREGAVCPCSCNCQRWQLIFFKVCENLADENNRFALQEVQDIVQKFNVPNTIIQVVFVCLFVASCYNSATDLAANQINNFQYRWFPRFS